MRRKSNRQFEAGADESLPSIADLWDSASEVTGQRFPWPDWYLALTAHCCRLEGKSFDEARFLATSPGTVRPLRFDEFVGSTYLSPQREQRFWAELIDPTCATKTPISPTDAERREDWARRSGVGATS